MVKKVPIILLCICSLTAITTSMRGSGKELSIAHVLIDKEEFEYPPAQRLESDGSLGVDYFAHANPLVCMAWSSDYIISSDSSNTVKLWDTQTYRLLTSFNWDTCKPIEFSWAPDSPTLAVLSSDETGSDGEQKYILRTVNFSNHTKPTREIKLKIDQKIIPQLAWIDAETIKIGLSRENPCNTIYYDTAENTLSHSYENLLLEDTEYKARIVDNTIHVINSAKEEMFCIDHINQSSWIPGDHQAFASLQYSKNFSQTQVSTIVITDLLRPAMPSLQFSTGASQLITTFCFSPDGNTMLIGTEKGELFTINTSLLGIVNERSSYVSDQHFSQG